MTPVEIDTQLSELHRAMLAARRYQEIATDKLHCALGQRQRGYGRNASWPTSDADALTACEEGAASGKPSTPWWYPSEALTVYREALARVADIEERAEPLNAEWDRRGGWSRYFTVQQAGGHIHASMDCSTCNRGRFATQFAWNPELSGTTEAQALASLGAHGYTMCTVCFPSAPVLPPPVDPLRCSGTIDPLVDDRWFGHRHCAWCADCGTWQPLTMAGVLRKHRTPKGSSRA